MHVCDFCGNECDCDMTDFVDSFQPDDCTCECLEMPTALKCRDCLHDVDYCICGDMYFQFGQKRK